MLQLKSVLKNVLEIKQMVKALLNEGMVEILAENDKLKSENLDLSQQIAVYEAKANKAKNDKKVKRKVIK